MATSRELSARVEIDVHRRPNKFRRRTWWASAWLSVLCLAWLGYEGVRGEYQIFEGGPLATPHKLFQNDCAKCHTTWGPIDRVLEFDMSDNVYTVTNDACLACHPGTTHSMRETKELSCAQCHIEHIGHHDLKRVPDQKCVDCHGDLQTQDGNFNFDKHVTGFASHSSAKHPDFAFARWLDGNESGIGEEHRVRELVGEIKRQEKSGEHVTIVGDLANIRFNHKKHIQEDTDGMWYVNDGGLSDGTERVDSSVLQSKRYNSVTQTCYECHEMDDDGAYVKPIVYENHCQKCHPLLFDNDLNRFSKDGLLPVTKVPHATADVVRGYLTDKYTLEVLRSGAADEPAKDQPSLRTIPGHNSTTLDKDAAQKVDKLVSAEANRIRSRHILFGKFESGCQYCHTMASDGEPKAGESKLDTLQVVPPKIPDRWLPHSRFSHESHLLLNCVDCHKVTDSTDTSDVLLPRVGLCQECHSYEPTHKNESGIPRRFGARTDCAECHNYHSHDKELFEKWLDPVLTKSRPKPIENSEDKSSK